MNKIRFRTVLWVVGILLVVSAAASPWIVAGYWRVRSDNPIRRGMARAAELGCFACHGELGGAGIPIPGSDEDVPQWGGGVWMMYVKNEEDVRRYIVEGSPKDIGSKVHDETGGQHVHDHDAVTMPAYGDVVDGRDLDDLVATFMVLSGMASPPRGTPARAGYDLAGRWKCLSCHGPAGSGGLPNRGSFTGFVPGWYGADFDELVRDRTEFDGWILEGAVPRLSNNRIASFFLDRQILTMPAYPELTSGELDDLWAYVQWLRETDGGRRAEIVSW